MCEKDILKEVINMGYLKTNNSNWKKLCIGEIQVKQLEINLNEVDRYIEHKDKLISRKCIVETKLKKDIKE